MSFTGNEDMLVSVADAAVLTSTFRKSKMGHTQPRCYYFSQRTLNDLLSQTGAVGLRFYFGMDGDGVMKLVYVAVGSDENDILVDELVGNSGVPCPVSCSATNTLNS